MKIVKRVIHYSIRIAIYFLIYSSIYYCLNKFEINKPIIVSPVELVKSFNLSFLHVLVNEFLITILRWVIIFIVGTLSGVLLGILFGFLKFGENFEFDINFWRSLPATVIVSYVIALFGDNEFSRGFPALYVTFFTTFYFTFKFCQNMDKTKILHLKSLGAKNNFIFRNCIYYEMLPTIMTTARQGISLSFLVLIATEIILGSSNNIGIGNTIVNWYFNLDYGNITLFILITGIVGYIANQAMFSLTKKMLFWRNKIY